jgi:hypothetical protein
MLHLFVPHQPNTRSPRVLAAVTSVLAWSAVAIVVGSLADPTGASTTMTVDVTLETR